MLKSLVNLALFCSYSRLYNRPAPTIGIGLASQFLVAQALAKGELLPLFPEVILQVWPFYCLYRDTPDDVELELFLNWLLEAGQNAQDICMDQSMD